MSTPLTHLPWKIKSGFLHTSGLIFAMFAMQFVFGENPQPPAPTKAVTLNDFIAGGFVELEAVGSQFRFKRLSTEQVRRPGREITVVYRANDFVRLRDVHRKADGSIDKNHARNDWWIPYHSIIEVLDKPKSNPESEGSPSKNNKQ